MSGATLRDRLWANDRDPLVASLIICLAFFLLGLNRIWVPASLYYDELYYIGAAIKLLNKGIVANREHPMLAKELMALMALIFGKNLLVIRIESLLIGTIGLFGFQRAHYYLTNSPRSTLIFGLFAAFNFLYLATARIAILDPYMLGFAGLALAFLARGMATGQNAFPNIAASAVFIGLSMASKWTVAPLYGVMGLTIAFGSSPKIRLAFLNAAAFGAISIGVYLLTFLPLLLTRDDPIAAVDLFAMHRAMVHSLSILIGHHPYESPWWIWPIGGGQMWLFDGHAVHSDRMIALGQNPVAVLLSLPAVLAGLYFLIARKNWRLGLPAAFYAVTLIFWIANQKPVQFLYHYNLSSLAALCLAAQILSIDKVSWIRRARIPIIAIYCAAFAFFYPAITGGFLHGRADRYTSLPGWHVNHAQALYSHQVGNGKSLSQWSRRCLAQPTREECRTSRQNILQ